MTPTDPLKALWASNAETMEPMTSTELNKLAHEFRGKILRRNIVEYVAAVFVIAVFALYLFLIPEPIARLGSIMVILGTISIIWSLHKRASSGAKQENETAEQVLSFHIDQLKKQRDALNSILSWYILPLLPGALVFLVGTTAKFTTEETLIPGMLEMLPRAGFLGLVCLAIWWLNKRTAKKLDNKIQSLQSSI